MNQERRRYFRINDRLALGFQTVDASEDDNALPVGLDVLDLMSVQDEKIEHLLQEVAEESPKVAALIRAMNQKLERVVAQLVTDARMVDRLARRVKEVSLSACGLGFVCDSDVEIGTRLNIELELEQDKSIIKTKGYVVAVEPCDDGYYWRVSFFDMAPAHQERLIQHVVQRQSVQLKYIREPR